MPSDIISNSDIHINNTTGKSAERSVIIFSEDGKVSAPNEDILNEIFITSSHRSLYPGNLFHLEKKRASSII